MVAVGLKTDKPCPCKKNPIADTVRCDKCTAWVHLNCENVKREFLQTLDKYFCSTCRKSDPSLAHIPKAATSSDAATPSSDVDLIALHKLLLEELRALTGAVQGLTGKFDSLESRVASLEAERSPAGNSQDIAHAVADALEEQERKKRKDCRAVIERMPESDDAGHDTQMVTDIVTKCGVLDSCLIEQSHRFGAVKKGENKNRILKIPFTSKEARDKFIRNYWTSYKDPEFNQLYKGLYVRRDLTPSELSLHQSLRSEAYRKNQDCGEFRYMYRDLRIVELKSPKPLKTNT